MAEISGIPRSRTFLSNPCNAAWSTTGPVKSVSPLYSRVIVRPPNQFVHSQRLAWGLIRMRDFRHETVSKDLRLKVLAAVDRGMPRKEVAQVFGLSEPTIRRYLRLRRQTGDLEPKPVPGPPARKREALERRLPAQVRLNPELTLTEHCELFEDESGMEVWTATMSRAFVRLELPLKKSPPGIRARRGAEGPLAKRGAPNRGRAPRLRGRVRHAHLHDAPVREGPEGRD